MPKIKKLSILWGKIKITAGLISLYITAFNFILLTITAYPVIADWLQQREILIPFWQFEVGMIAIIMIVMYAEYKISMSGYYRASNELTWNNDNPVRVELEAIRQENKELKEQNSEIKKLLEGMIKK
jgi:hypothetical protein